MFLMTSEKPDFHHEAEEQYGWFDIDQAIEEMAVDEDREFLKKIWREI